MERSRVVSAGLFLLANIFAISSLAIPDWLIYEIDRSVTGVQKIGILRSCIKIAGRPKAECYQSPYNTEWLASLICIIVAIGANAGSLVMFAWSRWRQSVVVNVKWFSAVSVILLCLATIVFPAGFGRVDVGGAPYQLPRNCHIGFGYIFFMLTLWVVVIAALLNAKFFGR